PLCLSEEIEDCGHRHGGDAARAPLPDVGPLRIEPFGQRRLEDRLQLLVVLRVVEHLTQRFFEEVGALLLRELGHQSFLPLLSIQPRVAMRSTSLAPETPTRERICADVFVRTVAWPPPLLPAAASMLNVESGAAVSAGERSVVARSLK